MTLDMRLNQMDVIELDDQLARRAGDLAEVHSLRGYDAVHVAAADRLRDPDLVLVAGDGALVQAATSGASRSLLFHNGFGVADEIVRVAGHHSEPQAWVGVNWRRSWFSALRQLAECPMRRTGPS